MILDLNRQRNHRIRLQAIEAIAAFNKHGIRPILLKGGLSLFEEGLDDGLLLMADVDILVQESEVLQAAAILRSIGYVTLEEDRGYAHALTFHRRATLATIDLHRHLGPQCRLLAPAAAQHAAITLPTGGVELAGLSPTHRVLLLMMTFAIFERHYRSGVIPLKGLHDLALIRCHHGDRIDWETIADTIRGHGISRAAQAWLHMANRLLHVSVPSALHETTAARLYLNRCLFQLDCPPLARVASQWGLFSWVFDRIRMDYRYRCGLRGWPLQSARIQHALGILARHNWPRVQRSLRAMMMQ